MSSLNGDVMVIRNGRSTSQVSVYNYPEHLNPFYEDDQHKRLRFWKISKKDNEGRRNSFSIGNLKDMWTFKSFRLKKKSSTLGITKTSESPPPLRREFAVENGWNTFDNRLRHSTASSINGDSFQRNATYRSSLQTLPTNTDRMGFNRNDDYRSTIQVPRPNPRYRSPQKPQSQAFRYVYGGSVTPQPLRNSNLGSGPYDSYNSKTNMFRGSSQTSMGSTNPFDSDDDEDNADASAMQSINGGSTSTLTKFTPRKKRRAPAPPTPIHGRTPTIHIDSSQNNTQGGELCIREDTDIAHLTAEIESFVKDKSNEDIETIVKIDNHAKVSPKIPTSNGQEVGGTTKATTLVVTTTTTTMVSPAAEERDKVIRAVEVKSVEKPSTPPRKEMRKIETTPKVHASTSVIRDTSTVTTAATTHTSASQPDECLEKVTQVEEITITSATNTPNQVPQTNSPVKTEIITVETTTSNAMKKPESPNKLSAGTTVSKNLTKPEVVKETKSNGAIPKKSNTTTIHTQLPQSSIANPDLCIKENTDQSQRPTPVKRATRTEAEQGQVECIHVHVGSPRAAPRQEHANSLTSFKQEHNNETAEIITTKTPFILTSPPTQRKSVQETRQPKEMAIAYLEPKSAASNELSIQEDPVNAKLEIKPKPPLSPKPVLERNDKVHTFAEIHKPMRSKVNHMANGHVRRVSHEELAPSPPIVHEKLNQQEEQLKVKEKVEVFETKTNNMVHVQTEVVTDSLTIVETPPAQAKKQQSVTSSSASPPPTAVENNGTNGSETSEHFDVESLYRPKAQSHMEWKRSTLAPLETHIPPEKRKSVKDIIESINRSQRLLHAAANKDFTIMSGSVETSETPTTHDENLRILDESQREIKRIVQEIEHMDGVSTSTSAPPSYSDCVEAQKMDNSEIFQKCKVNKEVYDYRETSPITSNLDWNPVPKPKRTKPQNE